MAVVYPAYEAALSKHNALDFHSLILKAHQLFTTFRLWRSAIGRCINISASMSFRIRITPSINFSVLLLENNTATCSPLPTTTKLFTNGTGPATNACRFWTIIHRTLSSYRQITDARLRLWSWPIILSATTFCGQPTKSLSKHFAQIQDRVSYGSCHVFLTLKAEKTGVARDISDLHAKELGSVAVLGRNRKLLEGAQQALQQEGLPAVISHEKTNSSVRLLYGCMRHSAWPMIGRIVKAWKLCVVPLLN